MRIFLCRMRPGLEAEQNSPSFSSISVLTSWSFTFFSAYAFLSISVQLLSRVQFFATPWTASGFPIHHQLPEPTKLMSITSVMPSYHLIFCHHFLLLPSILHQGLSNKSVLRIRWPKYWSFSFSICPSNEYSGLISLSIDWLDLLAVQGTLKSLLQHHSSKASILQCSAFFIVQLPHAYMTTGKNYSFE